MCTCVCVFSTAAVLVADSSGVCVFASGTAAVVQQVACVNHGRGHSRTYVTAVPVYYYIQTNEMEWRVVLYALCYQHGLFLCVKRDKHRYHHS